MSAAQVIATYMRTYNRLRVATGVQIAALWDRLGGLDEAAAERFVGQAVRTMTAAETATAQLTASYLDVLATQTVGAGPRTTFSIPELIGATLRGVDPAEVYRRPVVTARTAISTGSDFATAMRLAQQRARTLAETDVMLTQRSTMVAKAAGDTRIVGYRRVLSGDSCVLCATVSTQRYRRGDLMPIHDHCDCGVAPIYGTQDPGRVMNEPLLRQLKAKADGGRDAPYWRNRHAVVTENGEVVFPKVATRDHGELGPVLTRAGDHFTDERDALG